ncbi:sensor histidine kinase [Phenylobacterium sp.]|uniref:sensor histidine kinase n=1 Tax=Phenylobacterium sp. TaxID=1871053 RepID=UPI0025D5D595|nr:histidine kinase [Phenylobacterium sp.]
MPDVIDSRDRREGLRMAGLAAVFWTGMELWTQVLTAMRGSPLPLRYAPGHVTGVLIACALSFAGFAAIRAVRSRRGPVRAAVTVAVLATSAVLFAASMPLIHQFTPMLRSDDGYSLRLFAWESLYWLTPFGLWVLLVQVIESGRRERRREANLSEALIAAREAELRALHYQVNPHFLYNALNSIATLVLDGRNAEADRAILRLSAFFRSSLTRDPLDEVRLADEIAQQRLYLALEELRFPDCLRVRVDLPPDLADAETPSLILQPLVENAVKHGIHAPGRETLIEIVARRDGPSLRLQVADNGPGAGAAGGTGVGLANIRRRLAARYGEAASVTAGPHAERGYVATVTIPLRFAPEA